MSAHVKGFVIRDGKVVKAKSRKSVSQHIREKKSTKQRAVSRAHADLIHSVFSNGNGNKGSGGA